MNVKLHDVIRSVVGISGLKVIWAILGGRRDPRVLVSLSDAQTQKQKAAAGKEARAARGRPNISSGSN